MKIVSKLVQETIDFMGRGFYEQIFIPSSKVITETPNGGVDTDETVTRNVKVTTQVF